MRYRGAIGFLACVCLCSTGFGEVEGVIVLDEGPAIVLVGARAADEGGELNAVIVEAEDEKVEKEVGVEEAAEQQAVNLGFIVQEENFDQWVFNLDGVVDKGGMNTRKRLDALAVSRIEELDRMCSLNEAQKKKLELAARGDVVGLFDQVEGVRIKFRQIRNDQNKFNQIWQEIHPLQLAMNSEQFGEGSFFYKCLAKTLTAEQMQRYATAEESRRKYQYRAAISLVVAQLEAHVPLLEKQREDLIELTLNETRIPKRLGQYAQQVVYAQMSSIPPEKLQKVLDPIQMRILENQFGQLRGMKRWLIQQGILEEESPRKNKDTDD